MERKKKSWILIIAAIALVLVVVLALTQCKGEAPDWKEQYDLGLRYLSEGNYEEAILAFSAAIEIDPYVSNVYLGRGDAYTMGAEDLESQGNHEKAEEYRQKAEEDYRKAQELEGSEQDPQTEETESAQMGLPQISFFEGLEMEINTAPENAETTEEGVLRHATWTFQADLPVEYHKGSKGDADYQELTEYQDSTVILEVTEYLDFDVSLVQEWLIEDEWAKFTAFQETHPEYKIILTKWTRELRHDYGSKGYNGMGWYPPFEVFDLYIGHMRKGTTHTLTDENGKFEVLVTYGSGDSWETDDGITWHESYVIVLAPVDYDRAVFGAAILDGRSMEESIQACFALPVEEE